jgi:conjugative transfer region protein TrbK
MRGRLLNIPAIARAAGFVAVAVTLIVAAVHLGHHDARSRPSANLTPALGDRLTRKLNLCETLGTAAQTDLTCEAAWAENRRGFFGDEPAGNITSLRAGDLQRIAKPEGR